MIFYGERNKFVLVEHDNMFWYLHQEILNEIENIEENYNLDFSETN